MKIASATWLINNGGLSTSLNRPHPKIGVMAIIRATTLLLTLAFILPLPCFAADELAADFQSPPPDTRPGCYWYFLKDDVSKEGITKDLEAMARVGIGSAFIGYINQGKNPAGDNHVLTDIWWERLEHTFLEGQRLDVDIGLFNCPGWSQSGGPWITPERSMRNLVNTEVKVTGPARFDEVLPDRDGYFETVKVLAFRAPAQEQITMAAFGATISGPEKYLRPNPFTGGSVGFRTAMRGPGDTGNPAGLVRRIRVNDGAGNPLFEDDFSAGLKNWQHAADTTIVEHALHPRNADSPPLAAKNVSLPERFSIDSKVKLNPGGVLGLAFGIKDGANHAFWQISKGRLRPHVKANDRFHILEHPTNALVEGKWLSIRIESDGKAVSTFVDGALIHTLSLSDVEEEGNLDALFDGNPSTVYTFPRISENDAPYTIDFHFDRPFPVQCLIAKPELKKSGLHGELLASDDGTNYRKVCDIDIYHGHQGVKVTDPMAAAIPTTTAHHYRLALTRFANNRTFSSLKLSPRAMLDKYVIKQLGDIHPTPRPVYGTYLWDTQQEPGLAGSIVAPGDVVDLTGKTDADGKLCWEVPAGDWIIAHFGMVGTGSKNGPAMPDATGLECDKMNKEHIRYHLDQYVGKVLRRIPPENRKSFRYVIQDSYEQGPQNWTDDLIAHFEKRYGYDPIPWFPVTTGRIVGSADQSERFLWDLRRLVADLVATEYVGGLTEMAEANGLVGWLENYGHWGFPGESLLYGKYSMEIGGEFWLNGNLGVIECRQPASSAHIYGKKEVYAEAFTSNIRYTQTPRSHFKHYGDWAFTEGINHLIFHVYLHQPRDTEKPGVDAWFGTGFHRHNTWFNLIGGYVDYSRRVNYMMRQGANVADVCYYVGEGTPKMDGPRNPRLPRGYDFDFVNADVILNSMEVRDGRICIPDGPSYKVMVLPEVETMRPEIADKLRQFAQGGAVISGPRPVHSPSLENYPDCDLRLDTLVRDLWNGGLVTENRDLNKVLAVAGVPPDFAYELIDPEANAKEDPFTDLSYAAFPQGNSLRFAHRKADGVDIYFVANMQTDRGFDAMCTFRTGQRIPEIWNAVTGETRPAEAYTLTDGGVRLPIHFEPQQSYFFVFRTPTSEPGTGRDNALHTRTVLALDGAWTVRFDTAWGGPNETEFSQLVSWTDREEEGIRFYSGEAVYNQVFSLNTPPNGRCWLDLGDVADLAEVTFNGQTLGTVWTQPWEIEVTGALKAGLNHLQVKVANTWNNRMHGDQLGKGTFTKNYTPHTADQLLPAGLLGPVSLKAETAP